jgi:hypothetical protein
MNSTDFEALAREVFETRGIVADPADLSRLYEVFRAGYATGVARTLTGGRMLIPAPVANVGDPVVVETVRGRKPGFVVALRYENRGGEFAWTYDFVTDRPGRVGPIQRYLKGEELSKVEGR